MLNVVKKEIRTTLQVKNYDRSNKVARKHESERERDTSRKRAYCEAH